MYSRYCVWWRRCRPTPTFRPFSSASFAASSTCLTPGASTATGFSMKQFFPAFTAASKCIGRNPGGVAMITMSTPESITFW